MALVNAFGEISLEETQVTNKQLLDFLVYLISALSEKTPLPDSFDRMRVNVEAGTVGVTGTLTGVTTVATVSTVTAVTAITNLNGMQTAPTGLIPYNLGAGAFHLYNNILVS